MPGTTRYSATFDRTYEEEPKPSSPPNARRSRSQSWQANSGHDGRQYTPFASRSPAPRSSSTDNNPIKGTEFIPTRTAKTSVKAHNNPFQFVKVGTCPLYKKAEEQLKKAKEIKKPDVLKEEEEEWQSNLDSWKSRRRKMSEDVIRRQEEIKLFELEEQIAQVSQKKTKTFSEMVESRATRGRALSLCLLTSPLEFQNWEFENKTHKNGSCSYTDESGENSTVNSEDEGVSVRGRHEETSNNNNEMMNLRTNGDAHIEQNGSKLDMQNDNNCNKLSNTVQVKPKENSYIDSGLESISSSHRAGDTPDSGSDFSQDSNSSIDCDSPRTGVNVLEEFNSKSSQISEGHEISINLNLDEKGQDFGFTFLGGKNEGQVIIASILKGSKAESSGMHLGDKIITIDCCDVNSKKHIEIAALIQKGREKGQINLLLWRHAETPESINGLNSEQKHATDNTNENYAKSYEKSIESENEMYVDDFEELKRQSELLANKKSDIASTNVQGETNGNKTPNKDAMFLKFSTEGSTAPVLNTNTSNCAVEKQDKNEEKAEINNENLKKNIVKVKKVRRKGVYALNVDSNQISQERISTNSLFPLSPVTEVPSPADETKTISSTLSSNLPTSNSQNVIANEEKQNNVEIKPRNPTPQVNTTEKKSCMSTDAALNKVYSTKEQNVSSIIEKQEKMDSKNKTTMNKEEKNVTLNGIVNAPKEVQSSPEKDEISIPCPSTNKVRDLALKFGVKNPSLSSESALITKNTKQVKAPFNEKQKLVAADKKENAKTKENSLQKSPAVIPQTVNETSIASSISPKTYTGKGNETLAINSEKQPGVTGKIQTVTASAKGANIGEQVPVDNKQVANKAIISSVSHTSDSSSSKNLTKGIQLKKERKITSASHDEQEKNAAKNETKVSPLSRVINFYKSHK